MTPTETQKLTALIQAAKKMIDCWSGGAGGKASLYEGIVALTKTLPDAEAVLRENEKKDTLEERFTKFATQLRSQYREATGRDWDTGEKIK